MENPIKMDDLGVPLFLETPIYIIMEPSNGSLVTFFIRDLHQHTVEFLASYVRSLCPVFQKFYAGYKDLTWILETQNCHRAVC